MHQTHDLRWNSVDPIEKAIRSAFEKGDTSQRAYREKVYRSAFAALERALQSNPNVTPAITQRRRQELSAKITQIESEFIPVPSVDAPCRPPHAPAPEVSVGRREPVLGFDPVVTPRDRPDAAPTPGPEEAAIAAPVKGDRPPRVRRSWVAPLVALIVFAALIGGVYMFLKSGAAKLPAPAQQPPAAEQRQSQPQAAQSDTPPPALGEDNDLSDWISVFSPADPSTVTAPGDTRAEVDETNGESFMRIASGASGSPILFDVGQGILDQLAGRKVVFAIVAKSADGNETQISVECSLADLGDCGRKRFIVRDTREHFLFEVDLPDTNPGSGGIISINPDIEGKGRAVEVYAIRVTPAGPAG